MAHNKHAVIMACRFFVCSQSFLTTLPSSKWLFFFSWSLSVAILSLQPDAPTLQNIDCILEKQHLVEIYVWDRKMVLKMVWASLGLILATLGGFLRELFFLLKLQLSTLAPLIGPEELLTGPQAAPTSSPDTLMTR